VQLLQEDYIKWKGPMFFRALRTIIDDDQAVKTFAKGALTKLIVAKWPRQFHKHFVEAVFYYNNETTSKKYNHFPNWTGDEQFALDGENKRQLRLYIYQYMLRFMQDEHKFNTTCKLCQDVLGSVVEGDLKLNNANAIGVITDCLTVLASKNIKLKATRGNNVDPDVPDEKLSKLEAARGKILSKLVKKNALENIVPLLIELKHLFEQSRSPLLRHLMVYFKELVADYKDEIDEILVADPTLAAELKYDLDRFEKKQKHKVHIKDLRSIGCLATPINGMPSVTPRKTDRKASIPGSITSKSSKKSTPGVFATPRLRHKRHKAESATKTATVSSGINPGSERKQRPTNAPPLLSGAAPATPMRLSKGTPSRALHALDANQRGGEVVKKATAADNSNVFRSPAPKHPKFAKKRGVPSPAVNAEIFPSPVTKAVRIDDEKQ